MRNTARSTGLEQAATPGRVPLWERAFALFVLVLSSGTSIPLLSPLDATVEDPVRGDPSAQVILLAVYAVTAALVIPRRQVVRRLVAQDRLAGAVWGLGALALLSAIWSLVPEVTLRRGVALLGTTLFGTYLAVRFAPREQLRLLAWAVGVVVLLTLLYTALPGQFGGDAIEDAGWSGSFDHKNVLGRLMALGVLIYLFGSTGSGAERWLALVGLPVSTALLWLSDSKTSLVVTVTTVAIFIMSGTLRWRPAAAFPFLLLSLAFGALLTIWLASDPRVVTEALGRDDTLTGRTVLWDVLLEMTSERPWLGHGYNGFWSDTDGSRRYVWRATGWRPPDAHNGFLDVWLDLGLVGLSVFVAVLFAASWRALLWARRTRTVEGVWPLVYLSFVVMCHLTESGIMARNSIYWVLYVAAILSSSRGDLGSSWGRRHLPSQADHATRIPTRAPSANPAYSGVRGLLPNSEIVQGRVVTASPGHNQALVWPASGQSKESSNACDGLSRTVDGARQQSLRSR